ncbi:MAG: hypothetical protein IJW64_01800 [Clostridia bacterium]|nr:hypothetical protein [Clostridia bacterium]
MPRYHEHFVAFLDILGFKSLLKDLSCEDIFSIFEVLHKKANGMRNQNGVEIKAYDYIHHTILSDSIVLYIRSDIDDAFAALIDICNKLQYSLANRDKPILLRGGIEVGDLFYENDIIYGNGLSSAYLLENNLAKYPRIIFTGDTLKKGLKNTKYMFVDMEGIMRPYQEDDDALYYTDYFSPDFWDTDTLIQYYDRLLGVCNEQLNQAIEEGLRSKYLWLKKKVERAIKIHSSVAEYYRKRTEEKQETLEYNDRFSIYPQQFNVEICEVTPRGNKKNQ